MTSDIIFSSQLVIDDERNAAITQYVSAVSDDTFTLALSEEESDWESSSNLCSSQCSTSNDESVLSPVCDIDEKDRRKNSCEKLEVLPCSNDLFEEKIITDDKKNKSNSCSSLVPETVECTEEASAIKCQTVSSQHLDSPESLFPNPLLLREEMQWTDCSNLSMDINWRGYTEVISLVKQSSNPTLQDLAFQDDDSVLLNLTASVITCYPVREIWCKSQKRWQTMAALLLGDFNDKYIKLMLWGKQCHHALTQCSGNILYVDQVRGKLFCGELMLGLLHESTLVTICSAFSAARCNYKDDETIDTKLQKSVNLNLDWFKTRHNALCVSPIKDILALTNGEVHFRSIAALHCGEMVHVTVRIASIQALNPAKNTPCIACVYNETNPGVFVNLYLNGSSRSWASLFKKFRNYMWEIRYVACCLSSLTDRVELQTTVFSAAACNYDEMPVPFMISKKPIPCVSSYLQLTSFLKSLVSVSVLLTQLTIQSICVESPAKLLTIKQTNFSKAKQTFVTLINGNRVEALDFTLDCRFNTWEPHFTLKSSYEKILSVFGVSSLKTLNSQVG